MKSPEQLRKEATEDALKATTGTLGNVTLRPVTPFMLAVAQKMGLQFPFIGEEGVARQKETGVYPGALMDVIILTWLRANDEANEDRANDNKKAALRSACQWASENGIEGVSSDGFAKAYVEFIEQMSAIDRARGVTDASDTDDSQEDKKKAPGMPLNSSTSQPAYTT